MNRSDGPLIEVLKRAIWREQEKIRRAESEIFNLESQLHDLGVELPLAICRTQSNLPEDT